MVFTSLTPVSSFPSPKTFGKRRFQTQTNKSSLEPNKYVWGQYRPQNGHFPRENEWTWSLAAAGSSPAGDSRASQVEWESRRMVLGYSLFFSVKSTVGNPLKFQVHEVALFFVGENLKSMEFPWYIMVFPTLGIHRVGYIIPWWLGEVAVNISNEVPPGSLTWKWEFRKVWKSSINGRFTDNWLLTSNLDGS
jgi:hypothetical protein